MNRGFFKLVMRRYMIFEIHSKIETLERGLLLLKVEICVFEFLNISFILKKLFLYFSEFLNIHFIDKRELFQAKKS